LYCDLYENNGYEVLNTTAKDRSAWRESMRKKCQKPAVQQTTKEDEEYVLFSVCMYNLSKRAAANMRLHTTMEYS